MVLGQATLTTAHTGLLTAVTIISAIRSVNRAIVVKADVHFHCVVSLVVLRRILFPSITEVYCGTATVILRWHCGRKQRWLCVINTRKVMRLPYQV
ncbi:MAG: hypothetical protein GFH27_549301n55 [Chloroflexi bacterium AL-W]|nr:hypothetical protein [Chloroflexi bacterium AL-N1]NOK68248.1 hypothetical protein [Chloroflexi bacterium AL-N10]NOK73894.1 hypothetical protein [Chloroflexi bacterium AL-N5]NOK82862.1 hypothetical protein [Chloroflexi bacterium AL-W]NOK90384.1 hypothetical protein [Chloroflexi bacterium AL-N15]